MAETARPVHILSGFLGTGKTTFLNQLLKRPDFANTLVIVNEFGEVPLDHHLIESASETIVELSNGCLCCSIRGELVDTLVSVSTHAFNRIIIETTGIADPLPIHQSLTMQPVLTGGLRAGSIITVFDAVHGPDLVQQHDEAKRQIALADYVYLSMLDCGGKKTEAARVIRELNPTARIVENSTDLGADLLDSIIATEKPAHHHHHSAEFVSLVLESARPQPVSAIIGFLHHLANICGPSLLRVKGFGFVTEAPQNPVLFQMSGQVVHDPVRLEVWPAGAARTRLVVIAQDIDSQVIQSAFNSFFDIADIDTADRDALTDNPLAIPGL